MSVKRPMSLWQLIRSEEGLNYQSIAEQVGEMADVSDNPLLSTKPSDSGQTISLHPLVLLTISDHLTRQRVRGTVGPVLGALLGQLNGKELTVENAFTIKSDKTSAGVTIDKTWLQTRLQQYKDVHKAPALELVGWYTLCPESGPISEFVSIHKQIAASVENAILVGLHPSAIVSEGSSNRHLPLTVYEGVQLSDAVKDEGSMQVDGEETMDFKFRSVPYVIDTDETEMIAIDYVAKGAGSAAAVKDAESGPSPEEQEKSDKKGKKRADVPEEDKKTASTQETSQTVLTTEEEDTIAGITTRLNSVKMLQSRLNLLIKFVESQSPSYLSSMNVALSPTSPDPAHLPHLRNIQALLTRLSLLTPAESQAELSTTPGLPTDTLSSAADAQKNDVALASLLATLGQDIQAISELGRKAATVEQARSSKSGKNKGGHFGQNLQASMDDSDGRFTSHMTSGMLA